DAELDQALARCLNPAAKDRAAASATRARDLLAGYDEAFAAALNVPAQPERRPPVASHRGRLSALAARYRHWKRSRFPRRR
nr:hypothetical protein [Paracoccus sp. (in: a-proteobacteria)]